MTAGVREGGYDDWLDAVAAGEGFYLACPEGHASLPPRRACPRCGARDLTETSIPDAGEVTAHTVVRVPTPSFAEEAPFVTALAAFGPVRLTGVVRADPDAVEAGLGVSLGVGTVAGREDRLLVFEPR